MLAGKSNISLLEPLVNALAAVAHSPSAPLPDERDVVRRFLAWAPRAAADDRARAVNALARAYLYSQMPDSTREAIVMALNSALDDPSALVRRALAEAFASAADAPRHIVLALAGDQSDVARIVLTLSPVLADAELIDCVATGDVRAQSAIARRPRVGATLAAAIAEIGDRAAVIALAGNPAAEFSRGVSRLVFARFGDDAEARETLLGRADLPASIRAEIALAIAADLARLASDHAWLDPRRAERIARDSREQALVTIARAASPAELADLVTWLGENGALTVALLMRALMCGDVDLLRQSLVQMSGLSMRRVAGFTRDFRGHGFASLYAKAGLPAHLLPAFRAALGVVAVEPAREGAEISPAATSRLIRACEAMADPALSPILAMLWRFAAESAREDAREFALEALAPEPVARLIAFEPTMENGEAPRVLLPFEGVNENDAPRLPFGLTPLNRPKIADAA